MKLVYLLLKLAVLLVLLFFTVQNTHVVNFVWGIRQSVDLPLIVLLLLFFVIGAVFGIFAMLGRILSLRNEVNALQRERKKAEKAAAQQAQAAQQTPALQDTTAADDAASV
ncbi:MAG: LapA family protein [Neisseria sp.]|nr:LapA family protein [Neisseria sp.]